MSVLIRCKVVRLLFRSFVSTMEKKINVSVTSSESNYSSSEEDLLDVIRKIKKFIPVLSEDKHKGSCGRIGIIGGSAEYTGAPYFAGIAALKLGADLVHVFCCKEAAIPIKSYSPELMVHPILDSSDVVNAIEPWLQKLHALVIGPGLGKNSAVLSNVAQVIMNCKSKSKPCIPLIIDADGLHLISESPELIRDYKGPVILTPNANEYNKLISNVNVTNCKELAAYFNAVIVKKGPRDTICNGAVINMGEVSQSDYLLMCAVPGSYRRCGGQGDILAGFIGTFVAWHEIYLGSQKLNLKLETESFSQENIMQRIIYFKGYGYAAYAGCLVTRTCSSLGFKEFGRSLTTSDMINLIYKGFVICFDF